MERALQSPFSIPRNLTGKVAMVTKVGTDSFGRDTASNYTRLGISGDTVLATPDAATGMAMICVGAGLAPLAIPCS